MNAIVIGCSRRKLPVREPVAALELYQGGCIPAARNAVHDGLLSPQSILILSAEHGLLRSSDKISPYERPLTLERACELASRVETLLKSELERMQAEEVVFLLEPLYFQMCCHATLANGLNSHLLLGGAELWGTARLILARWNSKNPGREPKLR